MAQFNTYPAMRAQTFDLPAILSQAEDLRGQRSLIGLMSRLKSDPNYLDFVANGGGFSSYFTEEAAFKKHLERFYTRKGIDYKTVLDSPSKFFYAVERIADSFEMATRLGEYRKAIRKVMRSRPDAGPNTH